MTDGLTIVTDTAEIDRLVSGFDSASATLADVAADLRAARGRLVAAPEVPDGSRQAALVALHVALVAVEGVRQRAVDRAAALRAASGDYEDAEASSISQLPMLPVLPWLMLNPAVALGALVGETVGAAVDGRPVFTLDSAQKLLGVLPIDDVAAFTQPFFSMIPGWYRQARAWAAISMQEPGDPLAPADADGITALAERVRVVNEEAGDGEAVVDIQKIEHVDGTTTWTVAVHGTKDDLFQQDQPLSIVSNVPAFTGAPSTGEDLVIAAMTQAGIPPDDEVILAAHSQGGMAVIRLANSPAVRERFKVAGVVTFGSPVAHMPAPPGIPVLNVQHAEDGIAGVSGTGGAREGGPGPDEVVAVRVLATDPEQPTGGGEPHSMDNYVETAGMLETGGSPQLGDWERDTAHLFAEEGSTVTAATYRGSRSPASLVLDSLLPLGHPLR